MQTHKKNRGTSNSSINEHHMMVVELALNMFLRSDLQFQWTTLLTQGTYFVFLIFSRFSLLTAIDLVWSSRPRMWSWWKVPILGSPWFEQNGYYLYRHSHKEGGPLSYLYGQASSGRRDEFPFARLGGDYSHSNVAPYASWDIEHVRSYFSSSLRLELIPHFWEISQTST